MDKEKHTLSMADKMLDWAEMNSKCCDTQSAKSLSIYLVNNGYGNIERAIKEFAEELKADLTNLAAGKNEEEVLCKIEVCMELENRIDNLITELYGADDKE